jgi:long-chain acyl-CoA synthetase
MAEKQPQPALAGPLRIDKPLSKRHTCAPANGQPDALAEVRQKNGRKHGDATAPDGTPGAARLHPHQSLAACAAPTTAIAMTQETDSTPDTAVMLANLPSRISDIPARWAASTPDAPALHDGQRNWSYAKLDQAIGSAVELLRQLQVRSGDRVMIVGENSVAQIALIFGAARIGAWVVITNGRLASREVETIRAHCGARVAIYVLAGSPEAALHGERDGARACEDALLGSLMLGPVNLTCQQEVDPPGAAAQDAVAALIYTTGTTGQPKGVMLSHRNLLFIAAVSSTLRGLTQDDRAYGVLPISHVYGLTSVMLGTLYAGACLYLAPRFTPDALLHALQHEGLTILQGVPAMYARLLEILRSRGDGPRIQGTRLRFIYAGGSPLDPVLKREVEQLFGMPLHNGYGMTESSPTISQTRLDAPRGDTSVGMVIPGVSARIVRADGSDAEPGEPGQLWIRGPNVMLGYYREPALTAAAMKPGGWLDTGDLARREADGALFIVGRSSELIIRSGFNVYPLEVETVLNAHPAVVQSAVVGRDAADGNEEVVAFVEADPRQLHIAGFSPETLPAALHAYLAPLLAPYKLPAEIVVMPALPAAATGKVLRGELRKLARGS